MLGADEFGERDDPLRMGDEVAGVLSEGLEQDGDVDRCRSARAGSTGLAAI
jgi:hypothetical protein